MRRPGPWTRGTLLAVGALLAVQIGLAPPPTRSPAVQVAADSTSITTPFVDAVGVDGRLATEPAAPAIPSEWPDPWSPAAAIPWSSPGAAAATAAAPPATRPSAAALGSSPSGIPPRGAAGSAAAGSERVTPVRVGEVLWAAYAQAAATAPAQCHLPVELLAAIGEVESGSLRGRTLDAAHRPLPPVLGPTLDGNGFAAIRDTDLGRWDGDPTWDRAVGPMQFIPGTWRHWGRDGDGDGVADPQDLDDATVSAAAYLCAAGGDLGRPDRLEAAILAYNHSRAYLGTVLALMGSLRSAAGAAGVVASAPPTRTVVVTVTPRPGPEPTVTRTVTVAATPPPAATVTLTQVATTTVTQTVTQTITPPATPATSIVPSETAPPSSTAPESSAPLARTGTPTPPP